MPCNIIAKDHTVIKYYVNGKPQFIVERDNPSRKADREIALMKRVMDCGNSWADVYNMMDEVGMITKPIEKAIDRLSY